MRLGIRCDGDAGQEAGTGHVFRALEYARLLRERHPDLDIRFFMRPFAEGTAMVRAAGHAVTALPVRPGATDYRDAFAPFAPDLLIIDTLGSDGAVMAAARAAARRVATLDDLSPAGRDADAVINGILWATEILPPGTGRATVYQGVEYMPLRARFADARRQRAGTRPAIRDMLVCTGGHDGTHLAPDIFEGLAGLPFACRIVFCAGPSYQRPEELEALAAHRSTDRIALSVVRNESDMAGRMIRSDLAVLTGGTLLFEAAACGLPSIILCSQEHQVPQADWFQRHEAAVSMGFVERVDRTALRDLAASMTPAKRDALSRRAGELVDGRGMLRVVDILSSLLEH